MSVATMEKVKLDQNNAENFIQVPERASGSANLVQLLLLYWGWLERSPNFL